MRRIYQQKIAGFSGSILPDMVSWKKSIWRGYQDGWTRKAAGLSLKVWNEQYDISLANAGGNGNIPARYQDRYQNGTDELVLVFCDTEKKLHEQYEDIKRKINEFHGVDNAADAKRYFYKL